VQVSWLAGLPCGRAFPVLRTSGLMATAVAAHSDGLAPVSHRLPCFEPAPRTEPIHEAVLYHTPPPRGKRQTGLCSRPGAAGHPRRGIGGGRRAVGPLQRAKRAVARRQWQARVPWSRFGETESGHAKHNNHGHGVRL